MCSIGFGIAVPICSASHSPQRVIRILLSTYLYEPLYDAQSVCGSRFFLAAQPPRHSRVSFSRLLRWSLCACGLSPSFRHVCHPPKCSWRGCVGLDLPTCRGVLVGYAVCAVLFCYARGRVVACLGRRRCVSCLGRALYHLLGTTPLVWRWR